MSESRGGNELVIGIIGLGLIGGSIAKDLYELDDPVHVVAYDPRKKSIDTALKNELIQESLSVAEIARVATTTVIASPIENVAPISLEVRDALKGGAKNTTGKLVLDVASVKKPISNVFSVLNTPTVDFVATHPMAGTEFKGFSHARKGLFRAKPWVICPHENNTDQAIQQTESFLELFGPHIRVMDADTHDRHAAVVSHGVITLSNLIFEFISERHPEALDLAGDGFSSTTRLASGNPEMHASIVRANKGFVYQYLDEFIEFIEGKIGELREEQDVRSFFEENAQKRNDWLRNRKNL